MKLGSSILASGLLVSLISPGLCGLAKARADVPRASRGSESSPERVVFRTTLGDIAFVFYPKVAPRHVEQILKLIRLGVYDGTYFLRVERGFIIQTASADDREVPFTSQQSNAIHKIPAELSNLPHVRGVLSMAHDPGDLNSAKTSFSILLGAEPQLNGKYTVFGRVVAGMDVVEDIENVPVDKAFRPRLKIRILRAEIIPFRRFLETRLRGPQPIPASAYSAGVPRLEFASTWPYVALLVVMTALGLAIGWVGLKKSIGPQANLGLMSALIGGFGIFVLLAPAANQSTWVGAVLFFGLVALFKIMSRFESVRPRED